MVPLLLGFCLKAELTLMFSIEWDLARGGVLGSMVTALNSPANDTRWSSFGEFFFKMDCLASDSFLLISMDLPMFETWYSTPKACYGSWLLSLISRFIYTRSLIWLYFLFELFLYFFKSFFWRLSWLPMSSAFDWSCFANRACSWLIFFAGSRPVRALIDLTPYRKFLCDLYSEYGFTDSDLRSL